MRARPAAFPARQRIIAAEWAKRGAFATMTNRTLRFVRMLRLVEDGTALAPRGPSLRSFHYASPDVVAEMQERRTAQGPMDEYAAALGQGEDGQGPEPEAEVQLPDLPSDARFSEEAAAAGDHKTKVDPPTPSSAAASATSALSSRRLDAPALALRQHATGATVAREVKGTLPPARDQVAARRHAAGALRRAGQSQHGREEGEGTSPVQAATAVPARGRQAVEAVDEAAAGTALHLSDAASAPDRSSGSMAFVSQVGQPVGRPEGTVLLSSGSEKRKERSKAGAGGGEDRQRGSDAAAAGASEHREAASTVLDLPTQESQPSGVLFGPENQKQVFAPSVTPSDPAAVQQAPGLPPLSGVDSQKAETAELFAPDLRSDRSPASWASRLGAAGRVTGAGKTEATQRPTRAGVPGPGLDAHPAAVSAPARKFLGSRVGLDPATVAVVTGPAVTTALAEMNAEAAAFDNAILVGPRATSDEPRQLGLLAHELVHVARRRQPRFVPPILSAHPGGTQPQRSGLEDEEHTARAVEVAVGHAAMLSAEARSGVAPVAARTEPTAPTPSTGEVPGTWGGLPAPWEPMPEWTDAPLSSEAEQEAARTRAASAPNHGQIPAIGAREADPHPTLTGAMNRVEVSPQFGAPHTPTLTGRSAVPSAPRLAARDRSSEPLAGAEARQTEPTPDIENLARQVYGVLRRRIAAERRHRF